MTHNTDKCFCQQENLLKRRTNDKMSFLRLHDKENVIILNTPNRQEILKDGPPISQVKSNLLGRGAYGTVIKAIYKAKPVALKIIKNLKDVNKQIMHNESHILGWRHPNIVRILKIESTTNFSIVIMERVDGQCLQSVLDTTEIAIMHRVNICMDIISALKFCHKKGLLHMDIKPQNIIICMNQAQTLKAKSNNCPRSYTCKICDFGSSIHVNEGKDSIKGLVKGTLRYMAPEALKEEYLTPAADIYSLGITLWQMKYRHLPYYWIQCNEVVAYQVVKHDLRPNAIELFNGNDLHSTMQQAICIYEPYTTQLSSQSLENLLNILNENECELVESHIEKETLHPTNNSIPVTALNCNGNIKGTKVKRDLQCEFTLSETCALSAILLNDYPPHHQQSIRVNVENAERLYDDIFISCWHSDYKLRPSTSQLYKHFNKLL